MPKSWVALFLYLFSLFETLNVGLLNWFYSILSKHKTALVKASVLVYIDQVIPQWETSLKCQWLKVTNMSFLLCKIHCWSRYLLMITLENNELQWFRLLWYCGPFISIWSHRRERISWKLHSNFFILWPRNLSLSLFHTHTHIHTHTHTHTPVLSTAYLLEPVTWPCLTPGGKTLGRNRWNVSAMNCKHRVHTFVLINKFKKKKIISICALNPLLRCQPLFVPLRSNCHLELSISYFLAFLYILSHIIVPLNNIVFCYQFFELHVNGCMDFVVLVFLFLLNKIYSFFCTAKIQSFFTVL